MEKIMIDTQLGTHKMKRPTFLTIWLVFLFITILFVNLFLVMNSQMVQQYSPELPSWLMPITLLAGFAYLAGLVLLWRWKIIGFYLFLATALFITTVGWMAVGKVDFKELVAPSVSTVILYFAMRPVWKNFQ